MRTMTAVRMPSISWRAVLAAAGGTLMLCGCAGNGSAIPENPLGEEQLRPTLKSLQANVFGPICADCHNPSGIGPFPMVTEEDTYQNTVNVESFEVPGVLRVAPGDPENSYLVWKIEGRKTISYDRMPPPYSANPPLTNDQISTIREWIKRGALR
ncbi:MAG: hypothetical protein DMF49_11270 [Acidobacteria bacterium]|nr:MAG: hypothetical protein DMF49_11270 [Acidobacteriota bacterium]